MDLARAAGIASGTIQSAGLRSSSEVSSGGPTAVRTSLLTPGCCAMATGVASIVTRLPYRVIEAPPRMINARGTPSSSGAKPVATGCWVTPGFTKMANGSVGASGVDGTRWGAV